MKSIFILYMPGHAGNFLTRLFSLSSETIPQIQIDKLKESVISTRIAPIVTNREEYYSFKNIEQQYISWQDFHRAWPDFYNRELFEHCNQLYKTPFSHVVYSIHPHEFLLMEEDILKTKYDFYYVDTSNQLLSWINDAQAKLNFKYRPNYDGELNEFNLIKEKYNMKPINLLNIVTPTTFIEEYQRNVNCMGLTADTISANRLYADWLAIRGPK